MLLKCFEIARDRFIEMVLWRFVNASADRTPTLLYAGLFCLVRDKKTALNCFAWSLVFGGQMNRQLLRKGLQNACKDILTPPYRQGKTKRLGNWMPWMCFSWATCHNSVQAQFGHSGKGWVSYLWNLKVAWMHYLYQSQTAACTQTVIADSPHRFIFVSADIFMDTK